MNDLRGSAFVAPVNQRARIEWGILQGPAQSWSFRKLAARRTRHAPEGRWQPCSRRGLDRTYISPAVDAQREARRIASAALHIVADQRVAAPMRARPVPGREFMLEGFGAHVGVEIGLPTPVTVWMVQRNFYLGARRDGPPGMAAARLEGEGLSEERFGAKTHRSPDPGRDGRTNLVETGRQRVPLPGQTAWADRKRRLLLVQCRAPALGHRPSSDAIAIDRDIHRTMVERVAPT